MHRCVKCGHLFKITSSFCPQCGERRVAPINTEARICAHCGESFTEEQRFCRNCGKPLRALSFCEFCAKRGQSIPLVEGARFCSKCGNKTAEISMDFSAYQVMISQRQIQDLEDNQCFMARLIGPFGHGYSARIPQLLEWNDLLISVNSGSIYIYNLRAGRKGGTTLRPFSFNGSELPKVTCTIGVEREYPGEYPHLFRIVNGMLAVPGVDRIFLWDVAGNVMKRDTSEQRGGSKGLNLELQGHLIADLAGDGERFLAALVRTENDVQLNVYEINAGNVTIYYTWSLGSLPQGVFHLCVTAHSVYVIVQPDLDSYGSLWRFSMDSYRRVDLEDYKGCCRNILTFDNRSELIQVSREQGWSDIMHLRDDHDEPTLLLDKVILPQCYRRDGQAFWIVGRSLLFADGQNNFSLVNVLDERLMRMSIPPVRSAYGLCFIDDHGHLAVIRQSKNMPPFKKIYKVYMNGHEIHMNRFSPWVASGECLYGFTEEGLVSIDMATVHKIPQKEQGENGK